eukprot:TRINITY_DN23764_c0_g1_i1.p1 TRINITY_DN23764_c0_g1~~TRINITY_DN23764_c0_g1_i1.p1  ORF type:complete len:255 (+),score=84.97 TRINITY_DN23764_c0_g1_i1:162-926(+)
MCIRDRYHSMYGAQGLTVCAIGCESLDELEQLVRDKFSAVKQRDSALRPPKVHNEPVWCPEVWNRTWLRVPSMDSKSLSFSWVVDWQQPLWRDEPMAYIDHLMGDEGPGSLIAVLKAKGWISSGYPFAGAWLQGCFSLFSANFELTDAGLGKVKEIGEYFCAWLAMVMKSPVSQEVWEEMRRVKEIKFLFQDDRDPISLTTTIAKNMQVVDAVSYTHLRAHETVLDLVCRLLLEKKKKTNTLQINFTKQHRNAL